MPRIARVVAPKYPHHITQRGINRSDIFLDNSDYFRFLKFLDEWADKTNSEIWAYCLLSNHFHLLVTPHSTIGLGKCLHGITFQYAQYFNRKYDRIGRLWQNRYFSCPVDKDKYLWTAIEYIENNPVRAGLVSLPEEWKWSSAKERMSGVTNGNVKLYKLFGDIQRKKYSTDHKLQNSTYQIRKATSTGRPLGGDRFFDELKVLLKRDLRPKKCGRPKKRRGNKNMGVVPSL